MTIYGDLDTSGPLNESPPGRQVILTKRIPRTERERA
jgi:RecG-like helicase